MADNLPAAVQAQIERGVAVLKQGGVIAFPTDTVYGLGSMIDRDAVQRIYEVKGRPANLALPLLIADITQLDRLVIVVPEAARRLAARFWPGALTLVLLKSDNVPDYVTSGAKTVAVRIPAHPVPVALAATLNAPVTGTSANISGQPAALTAAEVRRQLGNSVDLIIEGGPVAGGTESTIVDMTGELPVILRQGAIKLAELEAIVPEIRAKGEPG